MKPIKGRWFPAKAFGTGNVSRGVSSLSRSSKLLVSTSLDNSGTTGGTTEKYGKYYQPVNYGQLTTKVSNS